jgi:Na+-driven multidrug efflux pump
MVVVSVMSLLVAVLNVALSLVFVIAFGWGLVGVALGTAVVTVVHKLVFWPWYTARMLGVSLREYLQGSVAVPLLHALPFTVVVLVACHGEFARGWWGLAITFVTATAVQAVFMTAYGLEKADRAKLEQVFSRCLRSLSATLKGVAP